MVNINDIKFTRLHYYIHSYYVKGLHDFLVKYYDQIIKESIEYNKNPLNPNLNFQLENSQFNQTIQKNYTAITKKFYIVDETWDIIKPPGIYVQDNNPNPRTTYHHHYDTDTINSVSYINPTKKEEGGELEIYFNDNDRCILIPQKDHIYFFPSWALHKPLPQTRKEYRVCINWGYNCSNRPIHKITGDRW